MTITATDIAETIIAAGLDHHEFKCQIIAKRLAFDAEHGIESNVWQEIAEFPSRYNRHNATTIGRAWELAGLPDPYLEDDEPEMAA